MSSFMQSDVFFFITTIAVVVVSVLFATVLIYVILILKDIRSVSEVVSKESRNFADDVEFVRKEIKSGVGKLFRMLRSLVKSKTREPKRKTTSRTKRKTKEKSEE